MEKLNKFFVFIILFSLFSLTLPFFSNSIAYAVPAGLSVYVQREFDGGNLDAVDIEMRCDSGSWQSVGQTSSGYLSITASPASDAFIASSPTCGDGSTLDVRATVDGYVTHEIDSVFTINFASPQPVNDLISWFTFNFPSMHFTGSDALLFSHSITVTDIGNSDPVTGASIDAGSAVCVEQGAGVYLCPISTSNDGTDVSVSATNYKTKTGATSDRMFNSDPQSSDSIALRHNAFHIATCSDFENINNSLSADYVLDNDLSCSGQGNSIMIGNGSAFTGTLDGGNHTMTIALSDPDGNFDSLGLFRSTDSASIQNLNISGTIEGENNMGLLVSNAYNSHFENIHANVTVIVDDNGSHPSVGGLIGYLDGNSMVINSSASGQITAYGSTTFLGGLVGFAVSSQILSSYSTVDVTSYATYLGCGVGGLAGCVVSDGSSVDQSFATGKISAQNSVGGLVGGLGGTQVTNSYATGDVSGDNLIGGFAGWIDTVNVSNSYSSGAVIGDDGVNGGGGSQGGFAGSITNSTLHNNFTTGLVSHAVGLYGGFVGFNDIGNTYNRNFFDQNTTGQSACSAGVNFTGCTRIDTPSHPAPYYFKGNTSSSPLNQWDFSTTPIWDRVDGRLPLLHAFSIDKQWVNPFTNGDGSSENPYQITNCVQLQAMETSLSSHYILQNDIDCSDTSNWNANPGEWTSGIIGGTLIPDSYGSVTHTDVIVANNGYFGFLPVGNPDDSFTGILDGNHKTISHLWIFRKGTPNNGLFGNLANSTVQNLNIADSNIVGGSNTGSLAGGASASNISHVNLTNNMIRTYLAYNGGGLLGNSSDGSVISNIVNTGGVVHGSGDIIGGLVGSFSGSTMSDSSSSADVDGGWEIGGVFGELIGGAIVDNVYSSGGVVTDNRSEYLAMKTGNDAGGFAGYINTATISNSYSTDAVDSTGDYSGGFAGAINNATINNSYATGAVHGIQEIIEGNTYDPSYVGGFAGQIVQSTLNNTFASGNIVTTGSYVGGYAGQVYYSTIYDAYSVGSVSGNTNVGGFAGVLSYSYDLKRVYSVGSVAGGDVNTTGGLTGADDVSGTITDSFWDNQTSSQNTSANGLGKSTANMKKVATFTGAGWNFGTIWGISKIFNNGYPTFQFYHTPDAITPPETPVATPAAGTYSSAQMVTIESTNSDSIRYSTSGIPADCSAGTLYSGAIAVSNSEIIYVRACDILNNSSTASFEYLISVVDAPVFVAPRFNAHPLFVAPSSVAPSVVTAALPINMNPVGNPKSQGLSSGFIIPILKVNVDLKPGVAGSDVKVLQQFLVEQNKGPKAKELKSNGLTNSFGALTKSALKEWQSKNGLPSTGTFGSQTRAKIKKLVK